MMHATTLSAGKRLGYKSSASPSRSGVNKNRAGVSVAPYDITLIFTTLALLGLGVVMVGSASVSIADRQMGEPLYYLIRQAMYVGLGLGLAYVAMRIPLHVWERSGPIFLIGGVLLLLLVLVPGFGRNVNGSTRWLDIGPVSLQVSEMVKLALIIYLGGYLLRHGEAVRTTVSGFLRPLSVVGLLGLLCLMEPDFGAAVVMTATAMGMLFLGGVRLWLFGLLLIPAFSLAAFLAISSPYRLERLTAFMNPWADPFNSGFQLTQALIAFGRGEWFGVGLGGSIQKLFYLPEAHTDFLFAVMAEELGLVGGVVVILLFALLVWRAFSIGRAADKAGEVFGTHVAYGIGLWLGFQTFINIGVNMGVLPTKGLTLPLMSYGGSSILASCLAVALLLRVDFEVRAKSGHGKRRGAKR